MRRSTRRRRLPSILPVLLLVPAVMAQAGEASAGAVAGPPDHRDGSWFGILLGDVTDGGVQVLAVVPGGPAAAAGLREGDLIVRVDGSDTPDQAALTAAVGRLRPGTPAELILIRGGRPESAVVVPAERGGVSWLERWPEPPPAPPAPMPRAERFVSTLPVRLGLEIMHVPGDLLEHWGAPRDRGLLVVRVEPGGPASRSEIRVGDVLVTLGGRDLRRPADLRVLPRPGSDGSVPFEGVRAGRAYSGRLVVRHAEDRSALARARLEAERARLLEEIERVERALRELGSDR